mgnify:CR=1 FL=1
MNPLGRRRYSVDYCGRRFAYEGAKDSYHAGEQVVLFCPMVATDTDYSFTLDGEHLPFDYQGDRGFRLEFTMPDHDVKLECFMKNSMVREVGRTPAVLTFESFDGGGPVFTVTVDDPSILSYARETSYDKADHEKLCGAGYKVYYTFTGLMPGSTTVTVQSRSPIVPALNLLYSASVDRNLNVTLTEIGRTDD